MCDLLYNCGVMLSLLFYFCFCLFVCSFFCFVFCFVFVFLLFCFVFLVCFFVFCLLVSFCTDSGTILLLKALRHSEVHDTLEYYTCFKILHDFG